MSELPVSDQDLTLNELLRQSLLFLRRCGRCGWPMCSEACSNLPVHRAECVLTLTRGNPLAIEVK